MNNPLKFTDPTGDKWWHWVLGDVLTGGLLTATATTTAAVNISVYGSFAATMLPTVVATAYTVTPSLTATYDIFTDPGDWSRTKNSFQIANGWFRYDKSYSGKGDVFRDIWQITSRFTPWENTQTTWGNAYANILNLKGEIESINNFHGATVLDVKNAPNGTGQNIGGAYIQVQEYEGIQYYAHGDLYRSSQTLIHEYGHYRQSRINGLLGYFILGINSTLHPSD
ncbi:MAG: hypothetical protein K8R54_05220 [Bacteroidales bacterium]|nr:hypothetical protein [Bacteroidales bacterium]